MGLRILGIHSYDRAAYFSRNPSHNSLLFTEYSPFVYLNYLLRLIVYWNLLRRILDTAMIDDWLYCFPDEEQSVLDFNESSLLALT